MANACLGAVGNPPAALYQGKRALLSYFRQSPLPKITLREHIIVKLCCGLLGHYIIILYLYCKLLYYNKSTLTNSFKSHTECFLYTHSIYFVQLYQKKHGMSTVLPCKNNINYHSLTSHIFYYTKKQPISRLFFVFVYMLNSHFIIRFSP